MTLESTSKPQATVREAINPSRTVATGAAVVAKDEGDVLVAVPAAAGKEVGVGIGAGVGVGVRVGAAVVVTVVGIALKDSRKLQHEAIER